MTAPTPGGAATLTASNPTSSTVDLAWSAATDDTSAAGALEYRVYFSESDNLASVADVVTNGTSSGDWTAGLVSATVSSLTLGTPYWFNVLVRDEAGNMAVYGGATETTLEGSWGAEEPLEDYTGSSAYYSTLSTDAHGEVTARFDLSPDWNAHYTTRPADAAAFGDAQPWGADGTYTEHLPYGGSGGLVSATLRRNVDSTGDVLFGSYVMGTGVVFEEVAALAEPDYAGDLAVCVADDGDVMVVWRDGTDYDVQSVRARIRTGAAWGAPLLVSASEGTNVSGLSIICDPGGDHVVLYALEESMVTSLQARVYDASADDWAAAPAPLNTDPYQSNAAGTRTADGRVFVAWTEYDSSTMVHTVYARHYASGAWSTPAAPLATGASFFGELRLAAAADDVHVLWSTSAGVATRRLPAGMAMWTAESALSAMSGYELVLSGNPSGRALAAWIQMGGVQAHVFSPVSETWGAPANLVPSGDLGSGSLAGIVDARERATLVYTTWNPMESDYNAFARTAR